MSVERYLEFREGPFGCNGEWRRSCVVSDGESGLRDQLVALIPRLLAHARRLAGADSAEDLLQLTLESALRGMMIKPARSFEGHILQIMRSKWRLLSEQARRRRPQALETIDPDRAPGDDGRSIVETRATLRIACSEIRRLPPDQRAVLEAVAVDGLSYQEAAELFQVPIGTVMSRLSRARAALAAALEVDERVHNLPRDRVKPRHAGASA